MKKGLAVILSLMLVFALISCGGEKKEETHEDAKESTEIIQNQETEVANSQKAGKENQDVVIENEEKPIKLGTLPAVSDNATLVKEALEREGYVVELIMFDANNLPAVALKDGDLDALLGNHLPWIQTFNKENGCDLHMMEPYYYYSPFGLCSVKHKSVEELPEKAQIVIPNDPSNMERSLLLLQEMGLITLGEKKDRFYNVADIESNSKKIELIEAEMTMTARNVQDVDAVFAAGIIAHLAGVAPENYIYLDKNAVNYPIGLVVDSKNKDAEWAKKASTGVQADDLRAKFDEINKGAYILFR